MKNKNTGAVSVLLCCIFLAIIVLVGAAGDAAALAAANAYAHRISYMSCQSVLAEYDKNLFDDYGLLGFVGGKNEIEERIKSYASMMRRVNELPGNEIVLFDVVLNELSVDCKDSNLRRPDVFMGQIKEYMKYNMVESGIEAILGGVPGASGLKTVLNDAKSSFENEARDNSSNSTTTAGSSLSGVGTGEVISSEGSSEDNTARLPVDLNSNSSNTAAEAQDRVLRSKRIIDSLPSKSEGAGKERGEYGLGKEKELLELAEDSSRLLDSFNSTISSGGEKLILCEYILTHFKNAVDYEGIQKESFFLNETEYILKGKFDDGKNLSAVKKDLFLLRTAMNMLHIYSDSEKYNITLEAAAATGAGVYAPAVQLVFAAAWAGAEAQEDINLLYSGGRVSFYKTRSDWKLDFDSIMGGSRLISSEYEGGNGLDYSQYLRLLLLTHGKEELAERTMDLIQINMKGRYDVQFDLRNCCTAFSVSSKYERLWYLPPVFPRIVEEQVLSYEEKYGYDEKSD